IFAVAQHEKRLGAAPKPHYSSAMPPEEPLIQSEIHALLRQAEQGSETVRDLASSCLANFRKECQLALEWQKTEGRERVRSGEEPEVIREETEERVDEARQRLKNRLEGLLRAAELKGL